ncbi:MAG: SusC/RagA family TonB-linked outer membrane protein [Mangrovibacterium sp.]
MKNHRMFYSDPWLLKKIMRIMKLTTFFVVLLTLSVQATGFSQNSKLNLSIANGLLTDALKQIEEQSDYYFYYNNPDVLGVKTKAVKLENGNINELMDGLLKGTGLEYKLIDRYIVLKKTGEEYSASETGQSISVSGTVTDTSGNPLPGVTVVIKGSTAGVITNDKGFFTFPNVQTSDILVFSFVGMKTQEFPVGGKTFINVQMEEVSIGLDEVVAIGYGVQKKATLSGSVTNVTGDDLIKTPVTNVSQGLAGRMPGVVAISNGGEPGYDGATLRIRGVNTFGNSDPLVVVDGVPGRSLDRIDPSTIESISVMKDASAAIYGAQAANGVILITTKRGTVGKPSVSVSYNHGFARPTKVPGMADAAEYATLLNEVDYYAGRPERYSSEDIQKYSDGSDPWKYPNTDWYAETLKPWSQQTYGNVSIDGGTENVKYFVSVSEKSQDGFYRHSGTKFNQYDFKSNLDLKINKYLGACRAFNIISFSYLLGV